MSMTYREVMHSMCEINDVLLYDKKYAYQMERFKHVTLHIANYTVHCIILL